MGNGRRLAAICFFPTEGDRGLHWLNNAPNLPFRSLMDVGTFDRPSLEQFLLN